MTAVTCGAVHGETKAACDKREGSPHSHHVATYKVGYRREHVSWPNEDYVAPVVSSTKPDDRLAELAHRITGVPEDAQQAWDRDGWVESTYAAFVAFLAERTEPFTTPEDFWPLIEAPEKVDMRAMSLVVQRALRAGLMVEVGAKRLRDVYSSRNGVQFAMNKLAPIYEPKRA